MSILTLASIVSAWRGYEYYTGGKVLSCEQTGEDEYAGRVAGSAAEPYQVTIHLSHPRRSHCNCPHADGRRVICKHMVALYFTAFPEEAEAYIKEDEEEEQEYEREREARREATIASLHDYVYSLTKQELQAQLFDVLLMLDDMDDDW